MPEASERRRRPVRRREWLAILRQARSRAASMGYTLTLHRRPPRWEQYPGHAYGVRGCHYQLARKLVVTSYGHPSRGEVLFAVFHELRHAEHVTRGLFRDYYDPAHQELFQEGFTVPDGYRPPDLRTAWLAEQDCNRSADAQLAALNIRPFNLRYPPSLTLARQAEWRLWLLLVRKNNQG
jgi:hypothetical protein